MDQESEDLVRQLQILDIATRLRVSNDPKDKATANEIQRMVQEERQRERDRVLACRLGGVAVTANAYTQKEASPVQNGVAKVKEVFGITSAKNEKPGEISKPCGARKPSAVVVSLSCQPVPHNYCRECLLEWFNKALEDTIVFPPKCCRNPIPLDLCKHVFPYDLIERIEEKEVELSTPNPTYCAHSTCGRFIRPDYHRNDLARCPHCSQETCTLCKAPAHRGLCPDDPAFYSCRCKAEFCYLCGKKWHTCECPLWEEERLTAVQLRGNLPPDLLAIWGPPAPLAPLAMRAPLRRRVLPLPQARAPPAPRARAPPPPVPELGLFEQQIAALPPPEVIPADVRFTVKEGRCRHCRGRDYLRRNAAPEVDTSCQTCRHPFQLRFINECRRCNSRQCTRCM